MLCLSGVTMGATEVSILVMLVFLRRRVQVAIALLREASKYELHCCHLEEQKYYMVEKFFCKTSIFYIITLI